MEKEENIKTESRPFCPVCNNKGILLYDDLKDVMFDTKKEWVMKKCPNEKCNTIWLDPTIKEIDIKKLYAKYTTHFDTLYSPPKDNIIRKFLERIRTSYLHNIYGYSSPYSHIINIFYGLFAYLDPAWRDTQDANIFYLPAKTNGLLLDVGCGNGNLLKLMEKKEWHGIGIDFDEKAIEIAKKKDLVVYTGDLLSQKFPSNHFDAITMNHVIEHVPSPITLVQECKRILKKDGVLIMITPNADSRGHKYFGKNWRGLEVPAHLQIFSVKSLEKLSHLGGFNSVKSFSSLQGIIYILNASAEMVKNGNFEIKNKTTFIFKVWQKIKLFIFGWKHFLFPGHDEIAVVVCKK